MQLLVSVQDAGEARDALLGGADIVDAKDPGAGPLGAVSLDVLADIRATVGTARPLSAALGDVSDPAATQVAVSRASAFGLSFVKLGFEGRPSTHDIRVLLDAARRGAETGSGSRCQVVAVAYADWRTTHGPSPDMLIDIAAADASGVLIDTADKNGPGLTRIADDATLAAWVGAAHRVGLRLALAGRLTATEIPRLRALGVDIVGVRGAASDGGRTGRVSRQKVEQLVRVVREARPASSLAPA